MAASNGSRISTRRCSSPVASTARCSSPRRTSPAARRSSRSTRVTSRSRPTSTSGDRAPDLRPHRGRPREPLQRGGDPRGPGERASTSGRRTSEAAMERIVAGLQQRGLGEGEAHPRVPRGRARRHVAPRRRALPRAEGDDRLARPSARLHAEHAGRGPLPAHARGVRRPDDGLPRRPRRRADRLRADHERRRERPRARDADRPLDGVRVRHVGGRARAHDARRQPRSRRRRSGYATPSRRGSPTTRTRRRSGC